MGWREFPHGFLDSVRDLGITWSRKVGSGLGHLSGVVFKGRWLCQQLHPFLRHRNLCWGSSEDIAHGAAFLVTDTPVSTQEPGTPGALPWGGSGLTASLDYVLPFFFPVSGGPSMLRAFSRFHLHPPALILLVWGFVSKSRSRFSRHLVTCLFKVRKHKNSSTTSTGYAESL